MFYFNFTILIYLCNSLFLGLFRETKYSYLLLIHSVKCYLLKNISYQLIFFKSESKYLLFVIKKLSM